MRTQPRGQEPQPKPAYRAFSSIPKALVLLPVVLAAVLSACGSSSPANPNSSATGAKAVNSKYLPVVDGVVIGSVQDNGKLAVLPLKDSLRVTLPVESSSGSGWQLTDPPTSYLRQSGPATVSTGQNPSETLTFLPLRTGNTALKLSYTPSHGSPETWAIPVKIFSLQNFTFKQPVIKKVPPKVQVTTTTADTNP
jgi:hypothetical protein